MPNTMQNTVPTSTDSQSFFARARAARAQRKASRAAYKKLAAELATFRTPSQRLEIMTLAERYDDETVRAILARQASQASCAVRGCGVGTCGRDVRRTSTTQVRLRADAWRRSTSSSTRAVPHPRDRPVCVVGTVAAVDRCR
jgi:hypothetical protein